MFQVEMLIADDLMSPIFVPEYLCRKVELEDEYYYKGRPVYARGRGCAATWEKKAEEINATAIKSSFIPDYEIPSVSAQIDDMPEHVRRFFMPKTGGKEDIPVVSFPYYHVCSKGTCKFLFDMRDYTHFYEVESILDNIEDDFEQFKRCVISDSHNKIIFLGNQGTGKTAGIVSEINLMLQGKTYLPKYLSWDMLFKKSYYATARDELEKNKDSMNELEGIGKNL